MSNARDAILKRLRAKQPDFAATDNTGDYLRPDRSKPERIQRFTEKMASVKGEIHQVSRQNWTNKLQQLCREKDISNLLYGPQGPLGRTLETAWNDEDELPKLVTLEGEVEGWKEQMFYSIDAAITSVRCGIADTGTLVLWPTPEEPRTYSLVPGIHFVLFDANTLYNTFADLLEQEDWHTGMPTNALLISGPSKSADIEQNLVYGVHGPMQLVILMLVD